MTAVLSGYVMSHQLILTAGLLATTTVGPLHHLACEVFAASAVVLMMLVEMALTEIMVLR